MGEIAFQCIDYLHHGPCISFASLPIRLCITGIGGFDRIWALDTPCCYGNLSFARPLVSVVPLRGIGGGAMPCL